MRNTSTLLAETRLGLQQLEPARMWGQKLVDVMATKQKPENLSEEDWTNRKELFSAYGNFALGKVSFHEAGDGNKDKFRESRKFLLEAVEPLKAQGGQNYGMLAYFLGICYVKLDNRRRQPCPGNPVDGCCRRHRKSRSSGGERHSLEDQGFPRVRRPEQSPDRKGGVSGCPPASKRVSASFQAGVPSFQMASGFCEHPGSQSRLDFPQVPAHQVTREIIQGFAASPNRRSLATRGGSSRFQAAANGTEEAGLPWIMPCGRGDAMGAPGP